MQALPPILGQQCRPDNIVVAFFPSYFSSPFRKKGRERKGWRCFSGWRRQGVSGLLTSINGVILCTPTFIDALGSEYYNDSF